MKRLLSTAFITLFFISSIAQQQKFSSIKVESASTIYLKQDSLYSVQNKNGGSSLEVKVENDVLYLTGTPDASYLVSLPSIKKLSIVGLGTIIGQNSFSGNLLELEISGSGNITLTGIYNNVKATVSGIGKINLSGSANDADFSLPGSGKIDASGMKIQRCNVNISGMGKCLVDVSSELNANISGTGSVSYKTAPKVLNQTITGAGKIKSMDSTTVSSRDTTRLNIGKTEVLFISPNRTKKDKKTSKPIWAGFELGLNSYLDRSGSFSLPAGLDNWDLRQEKSVSAALNFYQKDIQFGKSNVWLFTGLGITWNNYRFDNNVHLAQGNVTSALRDTSSSITYLKSKLTMSYLTVPVMLEFFTSKNEKKAFHLGAGAMLGLRIGSHTKQKIEIDGDIKKLKAHESFNLNPFRYGFRVAVGYGKFNLFADYYASTLFKDNKGPVLYPVNAGITIAGF